MTKLVFLDFDGVLHSMSCSKYFSRIACFEQYLVQMPELRVVISSSWRESYDFEYLRAPFSQCFHHQIIGTTPILKNRYQLGGRQREIEAFLDHSSSTLKPIDWIALDDEARFFDDSCHNLILVNAQEGFCSHQGELMLTWYFDNE